MTTTLRLLPLLLVAAVAVQAQEPGPAPEVGPPIARKSDPFKFQLLPKSFSSSPQIEMTVFSERTEYGRSLPEPSPEKPAYYIAQSQGYQPMGSSPDGIMHPPDAAQIETLLRTTLAKSGFLSAEGTPQRPTLALFYYWGTHAGVDPKDSIQIVPDPNATENMGDAAETRNMLRLHEKDMLQRANLVGGKAYAAKLAQEMTFGGNPAEFTPRQQHLRYQVEHNLYYVVVSAYDYNSLTRGERRMAWRTTLTVNEQGVSPKETLPPLILSATDFFGRDTGAPVALERNLNRGSVTLGPLIIIGEASSDVLPAKAK